MPTGLQTTLNGVTIAGITYYGVVDLEQVFHPRGTTPPATNVGFRSADLRDIADWFYPRAAGGATLEVDTGLRTGSTDLRQVFAKKGSVTTGGGPGGGGCLPFETPIPLWDRSWKAIGDLRPGDVVIGCYIDGMLDETDAGWQEWTAPADAIRSAALIPVTVVTTMVSSYSSYYLINGIARATFEHPFLVLRQGRWQWSRAEHLRRGDCWLNDERKPVRIESVQYIERPIAVANINVELVDNYFAQLLPGCSVLAHNSDEKI